MLCPTAEQLLALQQQFPNRTEVRLEQNYRSTKNIVNVAASVIKNNEERKRKNPFSQNDTGDPVHSVECRTAACELAYIAKELHRLQTLTPPVRLQDCAVLYRTNQTGKFVQYGFRQLGIPFVVSGGSRKAIQDVISLLTLVINDRDQFAFKKVMMAYSLHRDEDVRKSIEETARQKEIGLFEAAKLIPKLTSPCPGCPQLIKKQINHINKCVEDIETLKRRAMQLDLQSIIERAISCLPSRGKFYKKPGAGPQGANVVNVQEQAHSASLLEALKQEAREFDREYDNSQKENGVYETKGPQEKEGVESAKRVKVKAFIDQLVFSEYEKENSRKQSAADAVTLSTIHQAKGLEWDVVFVVRMNEEEIPLAAGRSNEDQNEEDAPSNNRELKSAIASVSGQNHLEEERRLCYVALSRARKRMFLTYLAASAEDTSLQPSRFLMEIPHQLLKRDRHYDSDPRLAPPKPSITSSSPNSSNTNASNNTSISMSSPTFCSASSLVPNKSSPVKTPPKPMQK
eukprot:CAMPEP_0184671912 /NCGR_PEP_ID=MMETSP0308-20130426/85786_1 /TAXON_ID=38269 /ORGANISM="Gloeochaete witrockiana, Strain SAG 46.84" /LENGTH=514 /DNA_ID=CAMNT_0027119135 /DNA_START=162 /DNA_END=1707 /DNA_ORIENTATION=+